MGGERREIMYSRHPLLWVWISDLQNVYPLNISAKRLKPMYHFFWHMSCNFIYNLSYAHCKTHCYGIFCFKCQTHSVSMEKLFFSKSRKEFPFSFAERGGRPYPLKWLPAEANYLGLWKRWGVISWR